MIDTDTFIRLRNKIYPDYPDDIPLNPPECIWYQEWWLSLRHQYFWEQRWIASGVADGWRIGRREGYNTFESFRGV